MEVTSTLAQEIASKISEQNSALFGRNWPEISRIMEKEEGDIVLAFKTNITNRAAEPGNHADKDNRIVTTLSFSEKFSDKMESALDDSQGKLDLDGVGGQQANGSTVASSAEPEMQSDTQTPTDRPPLDFDADASKYTESGEVVKAFKAAAKRCGWVHDHVKAALDAMKQCDTISAMVDVVRPYCFEPVEAASAS